MNSIICLSNHILKYFSYKNNHIIGIDLMTLPILLFMRYYVETNGQYLFRDEFINNTFGVRSKTLYNKYCGSYSTPLSVIDIINNQNIVEYEKRYFKEIDKSLLNRILSDYSNESGWFIYYIIRTDKTIFWNMKYKSGFYIYDTFTCDSLVNTIQYEEHPLLYNRYRIYNQYRTKSLHNTCIFEDKSNRTMMNERSDKNNNYIRRLWSFISRIFTK